MGICTVISKYRVKYNYTWHGLLKTEDRRVQRGERSQGGENEQKNVQLWFLVNSKEEHGYRLHRHGIFDLQKRNLQTTDRIPLGWSSA